MARDREKESYTHVVILLLMRCVRPVLRALVEDLVRKETPRGENTWSIDEFLACHKRRIEKELPVIDKYNVYKNILYPTNTENPKTDTNKWDLTLFVFILTKACKIEQELAYYTGQITSIREDFCKARFPGITRSMCKDYRKRLSRVRSRLHKELRDDDLKKKIESRAKRIEARNTSSSEKEEILKQWKDIEVVQRLKGAATKTGVQKYLTIKMLLSKSCCGVMQALVFNSVRNNRPVRTTRWSLDCFLQRHKSRIGRRIWSLDKLGRPMEVLFPKGRTTQIDEWDISLLCWVLLNVCFLEEGIADSIGEIRTIRNEIAHNSSLSLSDLAYDSYLERIKSSIDTCLSYINDEELSESINDQVEDIEQTSVDKDETIRRLQESYQTDISEKEQQEKHLEVQQNILSELSRIVKKFKDIEIPECELELVINNCNEENEKTMSKAIVEEINEMLESEQGHSSSSRNQKFRAAVKTMLRETKSKGWSFTKATEGSVLLNIQCGSFDDLCQLFNTYRNNGSDLHIVDLRSALHCIMGIDVKLHLVMYDIEMDKCVEKIVTAVMEATKRMTSRKADEMDMECDWCLPRPDACFSEEEQCINRLLKIRQALTNQYQVSDITPFAVTEELNLYTVNEIDMVVGDEAEHEQQLSPEGDKDDTPPYVEMEYTVSDSSAMEIECQARDTTYACINEDAKGKSVETVGTCEFCRNLYATRKAKCDEEEKYGPHTNEFYRKVPEDTAKRVNLVENFGQGKTSLAARLSGKGNKGSETMNDKNNLHNKYQQAPPGNIRYEKNPGSVLVCVVGNFAEGKTSLARILLQENITGSDGTYDTLRNKCQQDTSGNITYEDDPGIDSSLVVKRLLMSREGSNNMSHFYKMYRKILEDREEVDTKIRINVVGSFGQGKSALVERLIGKDIGGLSSTNGIGISRYKCQQDASGYIRSERNTKLGSSVLAKRNVTEAGPIENKLKRQMPNKDIPKHITEDNRMTLIKETKKANHKTSSGDSLTLDIWDFGGQHVYYATHTLFLNQKAVYLLVFDLTCGLKDMVKNVKEECCSDQEERSMEYYIKFWVNSIHSFVGSKDGTEPKIIIVGTHQDQLEGDEKSKQKQANQYFDAIRALFDKKVRRHIFRELPLDNATSEDNVFNTLLFNIVLAGQKYVKPSWKPAKWIGLEESLLNRRSDEIVEFSTIAEIASENEYPLTETELELFLQYQHDQGRLFYFDEKIVLNPQFLIDAFKCLITTYLLVRNNEARLDTGLIDKSWRSAGNEKFIPARDILLRFFQKNHIISEVMRYDEEKDEAVGLGWYVVPSLLKDHSQSEEIRQFLRGSKQTKIKFVISFDESSIVPVIYHRLIAAVLGKWPISTYKGKRLLFKNMSVVRIDVEHAGAVEMIDRHIRLFVLNLCPCRNVNRLVPDAFRRFAESVVLCEFKKYQRVQDDLPYKRGYSCNHESHEVSCKSVEAYTQLDEKDVLPCPELEPHQIEASLAKAEWFQDSEPIEIVSSTYLSDTSLSKLAQCITGNWELLGVALKISSAEIDQIKAEYPSNPRLQLYKCLLHWRDTFPDTASLHAVAKELLALPNIEVHWDGIRDILKNKMSPNV